MQDILIQVADPCAPDARALIAALDAYLNERYEAFQVHALAAERLAQPDVRFFLAYTSRKAAGCGALRIDPAGYGEIKRMYVDPALRGLGIARALLDKLVSVARDAGVELLKLETGEHQPEAQGLYRSAGFVPCAPFGEYVAAPVNLYFEKRLV